MATEEQEHLAAKKRDQRDQLRGVLGQTVLQRLGRPTAFQRVQVRSLWADYYRVNVLVGTDAATARIAHSYFLATDGAGNVLASTPPISKEY